MLKMIKKTQNVINGIKFCNLSIHIEIAYTIIYNKVELVMMKNQKNSFK